MIKIPINSFQKRDRHENKAFNPRLLKKVSPLNTTYIKLYKGAQRMEFHRFSSFFFEDEERSERLTGGREDMKVSRE